jgi:hypothetical protein
MTTQDVAVSNLPLSGRADRSKNQRTVLSSRAQKTRWLGRASLALPLVGAAAGAWLFSRGSERRAAALGTLGASLGLGLVRWQLQRLVTENIPYELEATLGDIEFRSYPSQVWAETLVEQSTWRQALDEGFHRIAGYIFGDNDGGERLRISTSVQSSHLHRASAVSPKPGEKLSMTTPVFASLSDDAVADRTVAFVMPADRDLRDLPKPRDSRVRLRVIPERLVAVLMFRGNYRSGLPQKKGKALLGQLQSAGIKTRGEVTFAGYDPPTTIGALRRNEVMIELTDV